MSKGRVIPTRKFKVKGVYFTADQLAEIDAGRHGSPAPAIDTLEAEFGDLRSIR